MKTTGVVRRIDDLGRIVIPKEIRRTLRIRDGESLEIFVDQETISLKKYSSMDDFEDAAIALVDTVNKTIHKNIFITDRDRFIAISGDLKKKYLGKSISKYLEQLMNDREKVIERKLHSLNLTESVTEQCSYITVPIIMNGDVIGLVILTSNEENITDSDEMLVNISAQFLGKYIEE